MRNGTYNLKMTLQGDGAHEMELRVTTCTEPSGSTRRTVSTTRNYVKDEERHLLNSSNSAPMSSSLPEGEEGGGQGPIVVDEVRPELAVARSSSHPTHYKVGQHSPIALVCILK